LGKSGNKLGKSGKIFPLYSFFIIKEILFISFQTHSIKVENASQKYKNVDSLRFLNRLSPIRFKMMIKFVRIVK
jgi:hypothetical protein